MESSNEVLRLFQESETDIFQAIALLAPGRIIGETEPAQVEIAEQHLRHAISLAVEMNAKPVAAQGYLFLGEIFDIAGRRHEALENLRKAEKMYLEMGVPPNSCWLTRIQEALARLG